MIIQGTFLLSHLWARVLFDYGASHSFIVASCVKDLGLEVETSEEPLHVSSHLGTRVNVDQICRGCELEILGILLIMDLRVMNMSEFDVILGMDWLTAHRVFIDCDCRRVTTYTPDDVWVMFHGDKHNSLPQAVYDSRWHRQLMGCKQALSWRTRRDRSWVYLRRFVNMMTFFRMNYLDYLRRGM